MSQRKKVDNPGKKIDSKAEKERLEREAEEQRIAEQEEIRRNVIQQQMENDPIIKYVEELKKEKETVPNPLEHPLVWGTPEEWSNIPQLVAKYCIHTQAHLHAVVNYLSGKSTDESYADLRAYVERQNSKQDKTFNDYKESSSADIKKLFECDQKIN